MREAKLDKTAEELVAEWDEKDRKQNGVSKYPAGCQVRRDLYEFLMFEELFEMPFRAHREREKQSVTVSLGALANRDRGSLGSRKPKAHNPKGHGVNGWGRLNAEKTED